MRVYYPGPDRETYHPRLGRLDKDKVFELDDKTARLYIDGGLLAEAKAEGRRQKAEGKKTQDQE